MRTVIRSLVAATGLAALACSNTKGHPNLAVTGARLEVVDAAGLVLSSAELRETMDAPPVLALPRAVPVTLRVTWLNASGVPDPGARDAALQFRFNAPAEYGIQYVASSSEHYTGTVTGTRPDTQTVFVPFDLYHPTQQHAHFMGIVPVQVR